MKLMTLLLVLTDFHHFRFEAASAGRRRLPVAVAPGGVAAAGRRRRRRGAARRLAPACGLRPCRLRRRRAAPAP